MMILSSLLAVLCLTAPILSKPATIVSGFGVDEVLKQAQDEHDKMATVDSSPEHAVVDGSTEDSHSHEKPSHESSHHESSKTIHLGPDTIVSGREHIHDPEHGNDEANFKENAHGKMQKWTTEMFGADDGIEVGGNSEQVKPQEFKKGWAPTEIVWSPGTMSNGYNGGVRRPEYRRLFSQRH